jgi:pimeloyl-ACP methyl ester carboxylesterase
VARTDRRPPAPGAYLDLGDLRLHVEARGHTGPQLLLMHGYLASTTVWQAAMPLLEPRARAAAVDLPGCGYSDRPKDAPYTLPWIADLVPGMLDALGMERAVLAGHSLGGAVAIHAAARHPERVAGLVLVAPLVYAPPPPPGLRLAKRWPNTARRFFASPVGRAIIPRLSSRAAFSDDEHYSKMRSVRLLEHLDAPGGWEAATTMGVLAADHTPGTDLLAQVGQPCLLCWGEDDRVYPAASSDRLCRDVAGSCRAVPLVGAGHNCHEEAANRFIAAVLQWLGDEVV